MRRRQRSHSLQPSWSQPSSPFQPNSPRLRSPKLPLSQPSQRKLLRKPRPAPEPEPTAEPEQAAEPRDPQPYRVILRLPSADPSAPAEAVTKALRAAGLPFEVETIERLQPAKQP